MSVAAALSPTSQPKVIVATTVMLSFISFWRAAAIVLNDLGSSAYYVGGIAEKAVGPAAPWFILGVMLFSYAVRALYVESCSMFTRGGVYRVVKEALGGTVAKISVSALMFDYVLTGPISGVSAGQYVVGLVAQMATYFGHPWSPTEQTVNHCAAVLALLVTVYFWWRNILGIHESSDDALRIMRVTTVMVVILVIWCGVTIAIRPSAHRLPPYPVPANLNFHEDAVGWLPQLAPSTLRIRSPQAAEPGEHPNRHYGMVDHPGMLIGLLGLLMAFGHSFLAMSGEESLAQVNRELEYPKHENLLKAGLVIFVYSLIFTSLVSFFAYALIPDAVRPKFENNLIAGIAVYLAGPEPLKLLFQAFIVIVGFLMLSGAVNTSIIGANGVLNRVSEDGVLPEWFREPHAKYGTSYRLINLIVGLQLVSIVLSHGNTYLLGEAYAFGVVWSFAFKGLAMLVLRYTEPENRVWKVPFNLQLGKLEIPVGLTLTALVLFGVAGVNLITKQVATISGIAFTIVFFALFVYSESLTTRKRGSGPHEELERFQLHSEAEITHESVDIRPGGAICLVRDFHEMHHLETLLQTFDTTNRDLVVLTVHVMKGPDAGYEGLDETHVFAHYEQELFSKIVALAEKAGRTVRLLVVPSTEVYGAALQVALKLKATQIILGGSAVRSAGAQAGLLGRVWETIADKSLKQLRIRIIDRTGQETDFFLGSQSPHLRPADFDIIHELWLDVTAETGLETLSHRVIVEAALNALRQDLKGPERLRKLEELRSLDGETTH